MKQIMSHIIQLWCCCTMAILLSYSFTCAAQSISSKHLQVSPNNRFLQYSDGTPFFYLGDTAWELFHRLDRDEADRYLTDRAEKGFTVIQAVALAEMDGHTEPNPYGFLPFHNLNPATPATEKGADNDYWDHVDYIVNKANSLGLYIGFLPTWGRYWNNKNALFNKENARQYGEFLGKRYRNANVIWILGGDSNPKNENQKDIIRAMAEGLRKGDNGQHLITFHPSGSAGSATWFHNEPWLDFNMRQNGHQVHYSKHYVNTLNDYHKQPAKPVIDGEPIYEDHPVQFRPDDYGHSISADTRRAMYWDLFSGAFGHTYGHHSIWQMYDPDKKRQPRNKPLMSWQEALNQPGAAQMIHGRKLMESRPFFTRIPDMSAIIASNVPTAMPGEGRYRLVATRDIDSTYIMAYTPIGRKFSVRTELIKGDRIKAWWYNPRNGNAKKIGTFRNERKPKEFMPPTMGEMIDWILVLDDADCKYPTPGK